MAIAMIVYKVSMGTAYYEKSVGPNMFVEGPHLNESRLSFILI